VTVDQVARRSWICSLVAVASRDAAIAGRAAGAVIGSRAVKPAASNQAFGVERKGEKQSWQAQQNAE